MMEFCQMQTGVDLEEEKKKQKEEQTKIRENSEKKSMKHLDML